MSKKAPLAKRPQQNEIILANIPPGVKLLHTLRGHNKWIGRIAWSPDGRMLATPSADKTVRLWDTQSGKCLEIIKESEPIRSINFSLSGSILACGSDSLINIWDANSYLLLRTIEAHSDSIWEIGFDPSSNSLVSASQDYAMNFWDPCSGELLRTFTEGSIGLHSFAFDPNGQTLAIAQYNKVTLMDVNTGKRLRSLEHLGSVWDVKYNSTGQLLASAGHDKIIKLWNVATGKLLHSLEGHTGAVATISFSNDGRLLASKGGEGDDTIRLWNCENGACVAIISEPSCKYFPGIAFHPQLPLLATVGSDPDTKTVKADRLVHVWELDFGILLEQQAAQTVTYTSAKIVLVGESNVGKSYLAHRIATGHRPRKGEIKSTHGMKFWPLDPERLSQSAKAPDLQRRDVVLWDLGGQEEYRLIHQLFLKDTTLALVLFNPIRGATSYRDVETWNKYLEKQLCGRQAVKLLVGAQIDESTNIIDYNAVERLCTECGFAGYYETSALTGLGISNLCEAVSKQINWDELGQTSRPALFQLIRDVIEVRRKQGIVVLHLADLHRMLGDQFSAGEETRAVNAVTEQLATQGVIARSNVSTGEPVLVLQVQEIERYAGSLIVAARNNPRGVPALELRTIAQADFSFPGITKKGRLPRSQEKSVLECTVQLMLENGICFQHEGLLVFPTLFATAVESDVEKLPHSVSLYYDFSGAIDNVYASLVAWLVLARNFGNVRLLADRAEFELDNNGLCGLRKVTRSGGFAHMDVYFETSTPKKQRDEFASFVEDHLRCQGVDIREHVEVKCSCGMLIDKETLQQRIARGDKDVLCPICETRHSLTEGASDARGRDVKLLHRTWALKTKIEKLREETANQAVKIINTTATEVKQDAEPIRLLHLSDLHFNKETLIKAQLRCLADDIKSGDCMGFKRLDYLVISGDFTDRGGQEGFEKAYEFVSNLIEEFGLSAQRCIFVPGNHDARDISEAFEWREGADGLKVKVRSPKYPERFKPFSDGFFHKFFVGKPYPLDLASQGMSIPFWETGIQFLAFNSSWQIDEFNRKKPSLHPESVANAIEEAQCQLDLALKSYDHQLNKPLLRIAVWHHAVAGPEQMKETEFIGHLQNNEVKIVLHGDVHEVRRDQFEPWRKDKMLYIAGAGSFGANAEYRPESTPRLYNLLEISRDLKTARVHTRCQPKPNGPWKGWYEWPDSNGGNGRVPYYDITW